MAYTIQKGDTLSAIAKKNNTTVNDILKANPTITNANVIRAGQALNLPGTPAPSAPTAPSAPQPTAPQPTVPEAPKNPYTGLMSYVPKTEAELRTQAESAINPTYNAEIEALKQATDRNVLAYNQQKESLQSDYQDQVGYLTKQFADEKEATSNQIGKRGLARSSIAIDALDRVSQREEESKGGLLKSLNTNLNNINSQITQLQGQLTDSLKRLDIDKAVKIQSRLDELTDKQDTTMRQIQEYNNQYNLSLGQFDLQKQQFGLQQQQFDWQKKMDEEKLKLQQEALRKSGSSGGGKAATPVITIPKPTSGDNKPKTQAQKDLEASIAYANATKDPGRTFTGLMKQYNLMNPRY